MENKPQKNKFKLGCLGAIIIFLIIIIIALVSGSNQNKPTTVQAKSNQNSQSNNTTSEIFKLGQTIKIGNYNFTLTNFKNTNSINDSYGTPMSNTPNNYAMFNLTMTNNSNSPINSINLTSGNTFTLKAGNETYDVDNNATISAFTVSQYNGAFDTAFCLGNTLSPNTPYHGFVVFETPKAITNGVVSINLNGETAKVQI
ncbi:MAG: DUF4352 domain-containing protein [Sarcina sp.]